MGLKDYEFAGDSERSGLHRLNQIESVDEMMEIRELVRFMRIGKAMRDNVELGGY